MTWKSAYNVQGDGFGGLPKQRSLTWIPSNLPYVDAEDFADMPSQLRASRRWPWPSEEGLNQRRVCWPRLPII